MGRAIWEYLCKISNFLEGPVYGKKENLIISSIEMQWTITICFTGWCWRVGPVSLPRAFRVFPNSGRETGDSPSPPRHHQSVLAAVQLLRYITHRRGEAEEKKLQSPLTWNFSSISYNSCKSWVKMTFLAARCLSSLVENQDDRTRLSSHIFLPAILSSFFFRGYKTDIFLADKLQTKHGEKMLTPSW